MKISIEAGKASEVYYNGKYYPARKEIEVPFSDGLRLSKMFYAKIVATALPYDSSLFRDKKIISMAADIDTTSGWGNVGLNLIKYSSPYIKTSQFGRLLSISEGSVLAAAKEEINPQSAVIIHEQPKDSWFTLPFEKKIAIVPFETTRVPESWVSRINSCSALFVPCAQNVDMMRNSGVKIPIEIVHWGVDTEKFYKIDRPQRDTFTFGIMGSLTTRKGVDILMDAFFKAFPTEKDVRIICKTSNNFFLWGVKDKRLKIDMMPMSHDELMNQFFREIDCFVLPTRGEGAGLPILEAQSTGVPVIATGWSGPRDYMVEETGWFIDYDMEDAKDFSEKVYKEDCGQWSRPQLDRLIQLMRYTYEHRDEVKQKGEVASRYVRQHRDWSITIKEYISALNKYL